MDTQDPILLAAELRSRAVHATGKERDELLFLAAEYEKLIEARDRGEEPGSFKVFLPR